MQADFGSVGGRRNWRSILQSTNKKRQQGNNPKKEKLNLASKASVMFKRPKIVAV